ncbi:MAG: (Fe-S)-binding protein [Candidatus Bathyarchaeia archaeon]
MPKFVAIVGRDPAERVAVAYYLIHELRHRNHSVDLLRKVSSIQQIMDLNKILLEHGANPDITILTSTNETFLLVNRRMKINEIASFSLKVDYIILEGLWDLDNIVKIVVAKNTDEAAALYDDLTIAISGPIAKFREEIGRVSGIKAPIINYNVEGDKLADIVEQKAFYFLPGFSHCGECGYKSCHEFVKAIVAGSASMENCLLFKREDVTLEVDGEKIPLKAFPRNIVRNVIMGIVSSLKNIKGANEIKIIVKMP